MQKPFLGAFFDREIEFLVTNSKARKRVETRFKTTVSTLRNGSKRVSLGCSFVKNWLEKKE